MTPKEPHPFHLAYGLHLNSHTVKEFLMSRTLSHPLMLVPQMLLFWKPLLTVTKASQ